MAVNDPKTLLLPVAPGAPQYVPPPPPAPTVTVSAVPAVTKNALL
jgi:hypothetical protein